MWRLFDFPSNPARLHEPDDWVSEPSPDVGTINLSSHIAHSHNQEGAEEQFRSPRLFSGVGESQLPMSIGTLSGLASPEASYGDWSLFGRSWEDYMSGDFTFNDPMMMTTGFTSQW